MLVPTSCEIHAVFSLTFSMRTLRGVHQLGFVSYESIYFVTETPPANNLLRVVTPPLHECLWDFGNHTGLCLQLLEKSPPNPWDPQRPEICI